MAYAPLGPPLLDDDDDEEDDDDDDDDEEEEEEGCVCACACAPSRLTTIKLRSEKLRAATEKAALPAARS